MNLCSRGVILSLHLVKSVIKYHDFLPISSLNTWTCTTTMLILFIIKTTFIWQWNMQIKFTIEWTLICRTIICVMPWWWMIHVTMSNCFLNTSSYKEDKCQSLHCRLQVAMMTEFMWEKFVFYKLYCLYS